MTTVLVNGACGRMGRAVLKAVAEATAEGGETDTAKWMTAGSEGR